MKIDIAVAAAATIGESPTWVAAEQALYWIDVKRPALYRHIPDAGRQTVWPLPSDIGAFALLAEHTGAVVALRSGLFRLDFASGALASLAPPPFDPTLFRFNEGTCDTAGRFWIGVMFDPVRADALPRPGSLHSFTLAGGLTPAPDAAELHNGMAWSADGHSFYVSHSRRQTIYRYGFDVATGALGARDVFATVPDRLGLPDGAAIDTEGGYWCALHGGGRLRRYHPDGTADRDIDLPVSQPTMCAFGGPERDLLYVTSATDRLDPGQRRREPLAGALLRLRPGAIGIERPYIVR